MLPCERISPSPSPSRVTVKPLFFQTIEFSDFVGVDEKLLKFEGSFFLSIRIILRPAPLALFPLILAVAPRLVVQAAFSLLPTSALVFSPSASTSTSPHFSHACLVGAASSPFSFFAGKSRAQASLRPRFVHSCTARGERPLLPAPRPSIPCACPPIYCCFMLVQSLTSCELSLHSCRPRYASQAAR